MWEAAHNDKGMQLISLSACVNGFHQPSQCQNVLKEYRSVLPTTCTIMLRPKTKDKYLDHLSACGLDSFHKPSNSSVSQRNLKQLCVAGHGRPVYRQAALFVQLIF